MIFQLLTVVAAFASSFEAVSIVKRATGDCNVNGYTFPNGQPFTIPNYPPCNEFFCRDGQFTQTKQGCATDNNTVCHDVNSTWEQNCQTWTCTKSVINGLTYLSTSVKTARCVTDNSVCHDLDSTWVKGCRTWTCTTVIKNGTTYLSTSVKSTQCSDDGGACYDPGATFKVTIQNTLYENCTCSVSADSGVFYTCYPNPTPPPK